MKKRLVVIDGKSVFYRGYYAMPALSTKEGIPTGGVYGFASLSLELIKKLKPDYVTVAWDKKGTNIRKRRDIYPAYKANRKPAPPDFYAQLPILYELLEAFGWPLYEIDDYEADDIMGAFADQASKQGIETCLITSDLDALQLVGENTHVYAMKKGLSNIEQFDVPYFEKKYGIDVEQFLDLKSLKGDSSDNIPGVAGIGEKTATILLQQYKTLDGIYQNIDDIKPTIQKKLIAGKDSAYMSKEIGRIWVDAPVKLDLKAMDISDLDVRAVKKILERLEFRTLLRNLPEHMCIINNDENDASQDEADLTAKVVSKLDKTVPDLKGIIAIWLDETLDELSLSSEKGEVFTVSMANYTDQSRKIIEGIFSDTSTSIIGYDLKRIVKRLHKNNVQTPHLEHDIAQGAFLLNSLRRERGFDTLLNQTIDINNYGMVHAGIWSIYNQQVKDFEKMPELHLLAKNIDFTLIEILAGIELRGVKIDTDFFAVMSKEITKKLHNLQNETYEMVGHEFNLASPAQLAGVLFDTLGLPTTGIKKGKTGFSTGQKELDKLRGQHPIIEMIEQVREIAKLKNTYVDTLPKLVDENSRLHTTFKQDVAATGRLSSTEPNLQNIPIRSELGRSIRKGFIAEEGKVLISADYSQFELRLAAILAGDKQMIKDFNGDIDIHTKTASDVYGVSLEDVTKDQRRDAKVINFGILYGMSPHGLSAATGMTFGDAKRFITQYFELRAPIRSYIDETLEKAKTKGYVETLFGRRRPTPDVLSSNFIVRESAKRAAANMPIQGTEADLMKMAMIQLERVLPNDAHQILQIHDSILVECLEKDVEVVSAVMKKTMESVYPKLGINLRVDISVGKNWGEM